MNWTAADFAIIVLLLLGPGILYKFVISKMRTKRARLTTGIVIAVVVLLIWVELAVGIFGTPLSGS